MLAKSKIKKSIAFEDICSSIKDCPENTFKHFIPHFIYVSDEVKSKLINEGFKIYQGQWYQGELGLIIEW